MAPGANDLPSRAAGTPDREHAGLPGTSEQTAVPVLSVVVPTYNRRERLERVLTELAEQDLAEAFEVIVVSDGSTDDTEAYLAGVDLPIDLRWTTHRNAGPAVTRNRGVELARSDLVVLLDDDVVPDSRLLSAHLAAQRRLGPSMVVIGPMLNPSDHEMSPWVAWEQRMLYKQYDALERAEFEPTFMQFYTGNASMRRADVVDVGGFDERYQRAEDIELGIRLWKHGTRFAHLDQRRRNARSRHGPHLVAPSWRRHAGHHLRRPQPLPELWSGRRAQRDGRARCGEPARPSGSELVAHPLEPTGDTVTARVIYRRRQAGFTLLEMMAALVAGLIAIGSIYTLSSASSKHFHEQQRISQTQMSLRMAMSRLTSDIARAGFGGTPNSAAELNLGMLACNQAPVNRAQRRHVYRPPRCRVLGRSQRRHQRHPDRPTSICSATTRPRTCIARCPRAATNQLDDPVERGTRSRAASASTSDPVRPYNQEARSKTSFVAGRLIHVRTTDQKHFYARVVAIQRHPRHSYSGDVHSRVQLLQRAPRRRDGVSAQPHSVPHRQHGRRCAERHDRH